MFGVLQTATAGLLSSSSQAALAAQNLVRSTSPSSVAPPEAAELNRGNDAYRRAANAASGTQRPSVSSPSLSSLTAFTPAQQSNPSSPEQEFVNLKIAEHAYKANLAVIRTADQTIGHLLKEMS